MVGTLQRGYVQTHSLWLWDPQAPGTQSFRRLHVQLWRVVRGVPCGILYLDHPLQALWAAGPGSQQ